MKTVKNMVYAFLDLITLNKGISRTINGFKIKFPAKWSRYFEEDYEKENVEFLKKHCKGNITVLDIGAHLGLMSVICSQLLEEDGKIYAFEPTPLTFDALNRIVQINDHGGKIKTVNKAIAAENGEMHFYITNTEGSNSNSLVPKNHQERNAIKINVTSIDAFVKENNIAQVDILKIDAEGTEYSVLLGAHKTIIECKPKIILAIHPPLIRNNNHNTETIYDYLTEHNYEINLNNKKLLKSEFCNYEDFFDVHLIQKN